MLMDRIAEFSDGASRSGLYATVSLLLERLKAENRIDVFQTVKTAQAMRSRTVYNFVRTLRRLMFTQLSGPIQIRVSVGARLFGSDPIDAQPMQTNKILKMITFGH